MKSKTPWLILISWAVIPCKLCHAQGPEWQKATNWTLYNTGGDKYYKVNADSLSRYPHRLLNADSMREFLTHVVLMPPDNPPISMGAFVASCIIDGKQRKIDISRYGGFFYDETGEKYYELPKALQKDWLTYFRSCASALVTAK
jgi:hypothetical protein